MTASAKKRSLIALVATLVVIAIAAVAMNARSDVPPNVTTTDVTKGDFVDYIQIRGDIRPAKSIVLAAPLQSGGDLQIVKLVKNGAIVKKGEVVVEFDATTLRQRLLERQSELNQALKEIEQTQAQAKITAEQQQTALMKAKYDVERAKLDLGKRDLVSRIEYESADGRLEYRDVELVTEHYSRSQLAGKSAAGFALYRAAGAGGSSRRGGTPFDPHHLERL